MNRPVQIYFNFSTRTHARTHMVYQINILIYISFGVYNNLRIMHGIEELQISDFQHQHNNVYIRGKGGWI